ncbi:unnamed protein product [Cochlearia groenlandica]
MENASTPRTLAEGHSEVKSAGKVSSPSPEDFLGFTVQEEIKSSGNATLDKLENVSRTGKGAKVTGEDDKSLDIVLLSLERCSKSPQDSKRDKDVACSVQSLRIISNLVASRAIVSVGMIEKVTCALLDFTNALVGMKSSEFNNIIPKSLPVTKNLVGHTEGNKNTEFLHQALDQSSWNLCTEDLKTSTPDSASKQILEHANMSRILDHLCLCLATSGASLAYGSSHMLAAACEACRTIWVLIDTSETFFKKDNAYIFPQDALQSHRFSRLDERNHEWGPLSEKLVDTVRRTFLRSKHLLSRCFLHSEVIPTMLCGLPGSLPITIVVSGGEDGTVI